MAGRDALARGGWADGVRIAPAREAAAELIARRAGLEGRRSVWVTDLVDLRPGYWRNVAPVVPTPERRALMEAGREAHVRVGHALAEARYREVRLQREGITGQIDLLEDRPTELKTTRLLPGSDPARSVRPSYLDQLVMYCALSERPEGRLLLVDPSTAPVAVAAFDLHVPDLAPVWVEMRERARLLREALERRTPSELPVCPWRGRGCEFETSEVCGCGGSEPPPRPSLGALASPPAPAPSVAEQVGARLRDPPGPAPPARRFRDLLYPRRAYFERTEPPDEPEEGAPAERAGGGDDLYRTLSDLLEAGPVGEVSREPTRDGEPIESVACFRGDPILLKVSRAWNATARDDLLAAQPQYFLDLALRCGALGRNDGWLLIGYARAPSWDEKVYLYRVSFGDVSALEAELAARRETLRAAIAAGRPFDLPACPTWMYESCRYRSRCDCAGISGAERSHR